MRINIHFHDRTPRMRAMFRASADNKKPCACGCGGVGTCGHTHDSTGWIEVRREIWTNLKIGKTYRFDGRIGRVINKNEGRGGNPLVQVEWQDAARDSSGGVEVWGHRGTKSTPFRMTFKSQQEYERWLEKNGDDVTIQGTRSADAREMTRAAVMAKIRSGEWEAITDPPARAGGYWELRKTSGGQRFTVMLKDAVSGDLPRLAREAVAAGKSESQFRAMLRAIPIEGSELNMAMSHYARERSNKEGQRYSLSSDAYTKTAYKGYLIINSVFNPGDFYIKKDNTTVATAHSMEEAKRIINSLTGDGGPYAPATGGVRG